MPVDAIEKLVGKTPEEITEIVQRYAKFFIVYTQILTDALNEGDTEMLYEMYKKRIAYEIRMATKNRSMVRATIKNPSPELPRPDSSI